MCERAHRGKIMRRTLGWLYVVAAIMQSTPPAAAANDVAVITGPYGPCVPPDTKPKPGVFNGQSVNRPASEAAARLTERLMKAAAHNDKPEISAVVADTYLGLSRSGTCLDAIRALEARCHRLPAVQSYASDEVAITWVCGGAPVYSAFLTIRSGQVTNIWSQDFSKPIPVAPPRSEPSQGPHASKPAEVPR